MTTWADDEVGGSVWSEDEAAGTAFVQDVTGSFYGVVSFIDNANNLLKLINNGGVTDFIGATSPFTFASGDIIYADIEYPIA